METAGKIRADCAHFGLPEPAFETARELEAELHELETVWTLVGVKTWCRYDVVLCVASEY